MIEEYYCNEGENLLDVVCPGIWFQLHILGLKCRDGNKRKRKLFEETIEDHRNDFFCIHCRKHLDLLCKKIPLSSFSGTYDENGRDIGLFKWTWLIHNKVNRRLGKPTMAFNVALKMFSELLDNEGSCSVCSK